MAAVSTLPASRRRAIREALLDWYDHNRRDLPWRARPGEVADPYRVWLSEIMLQQTTVPHATPYFVEFTRRWPTVEALARARDEDLMAAWAGLGYYARARNLLACARAVTNLHGGVFPGSEAELRRLPGVGDYTAAAIAAIAFGRRANVVDGNVERVVARLFAFEDPLPAGKPRLKALAAMLVDDDRPGDWAQALMDLGSGVCRPRQPLCLVCPLASECSAARDRRAGAVPGEVRQGRAAPAPRRGLHPAPRRHRRPGRAPREGPARRHESAADLRVGATPLSESEATGAAPVAGAWRRLGEVDHVFTHFSLTLAVYELETAARDADHPLDPDGDCGGGDAQPVPQGPRASGAAEVGADLGPERVDGGEARVGLEVPVGPAVAGALLPGQGAHLVDRA